MRVLVTGGSGFIGSHVVDKLRERGTEVRIFDLRRSPYAAEREVETVIGSVTDPEAVELAMEGCDAVIHLAAVADVNEVHGDPSYSENVNTRGTLNVLEAMKRTGIKRVLYGSTIWVYSDCAEDAVDEETVVPAPRHFYTATKLAGETYCKAYAELYGIEYTILRFGIPYGPRAREAAVIPVFMRKAMAGEPLTIAGTGSQSRRFIYVEDLADGVVRALEPVAANRIYNLASEETVTMLELAEVVRTTVRDVEIVHTEARPGDFDGKEISSERAARDLGWSPATSFVEGIRRYATWRSESAAATGGLAPADSATARKVLIFTAEVGEGHDLPARVVAADLKAEEPGTEVTIRDGAEDMGRFTNWMTKDNSRILFRHFPWLFHFQYWLLMSFPPTRWFGNKLMYWLSNRRLMRLIRSYDPAAVVSTWPGTTAVLGELRKRGKLKVPACSVITDLAGLYFWAHPGIDLHTVTHPESIDEVERIAGPGSVRWARPPSYRDFLDPRPRAEARRSLNLPEQERIVLVSGGGWGVGDVSGAIRATRGVDDALVYCLTGRSEELKQRTEREFADDARVRAIGFTERMSDWLSAADALIHSTGGLTVLEAIVCGCPAISYGFPVGHVRMNEEAYRRFGLAAVARSQEELAVHLRQAFSERPEPDARFAQRPSAASLVLELEPRVEPVPAWRLRLSHALAAGTAAFLLVTAGFATDDSYRLVAKTLKLKPITSVSTNRPDIGLLIDAPPQLVQRVAHRLAARRADATFALSRTPAAATLAALDRAGDDAIPRLKPGGPVRWLGTRGQLKRMEKQLGLSGHVYYAEPGKGFTLGQYLMGRTAGGKVVAGAVRVSGPADQGRPPHAGDVVEVAADGDAQTWSATLDGVLDRLDRARLHAVTVNALLAERGDGESGGLSN